MSSWLNEINIVQNLAQNLLVSKKTRYQEDMIKFTALKSNRLDFKTETVTNRFGQKLKATVFPPANNQTQCCIIYLHGYGSHRLEGLSLLPNLSREIGLCCFDFSGSGKSQGQTSTFGMKQSLDIESIIAMLKQQYGFKKIVLWGRSMGAVASILYTSRTASKDVFFQVLDSPFSSFEAISLHHAKNIIGLPEVFLNMGLSIVKDFLQENRFNPYNLDMCQSIKQCQTPSLFVYSQEDKIIPSENSVEIIRNFPSESIYQKLIISEDHNTFRSKQTIQYILNTIKKYIGNEKAKEKVKHKKGFNQIVCSITPNNKESKKNFSFIDCSLSRKNRANPESIEKKYPISCCRGLSCVSSPLLKN